MGSKFFKFFTSKNIPPPSRNDGRKKNSKKKNGWCICDESNVLVQTGIFREKSFFDIFHLHKRPYTLCYDQTPCATTIVGRLDGWLVCSYIANTPLCATTATTPCVMCAGNVNVRRLFNNSILYVCVYVSVPGQV